MTAAWGLEVSSPDYGHGDVSLVGFDLGGGLIRLNTPRPNVQVQR